MTKESADLLASCRELRAALAAAMYVIATQSIEAQYEFAFELAQLGIVDGVGVRADDAIANAEKMP